MKEKVDFLVNWLQTKVSGAHSKGLVVGVSGGLDSAVVGNLIQRAFPNDSLGVILPVKSNPEDREHAIKTVKAAQLKYIEIDLTDSHQQLLTTVLKALRTKFEADDSRLQMSDANLRARLRMSTLYTIANELNYLVVGTDNAAEWYTGYFTKYGDGGIDINPLVHLTKRQVREMAQFLDVPDVVINKTPSAGLWVGQTDEEELGTTYEMIDNYLEGIAIPKEDQHLIEKLHDQTKHKRQIPPYPPKF